MARIERWLGCLLLAALSPGLSALSPAGPSTNPFDALELIEPVPDTRDASRESAFCQQAREARQRHLQNTADLKPGGPWLADDATVCFTAEENLFFVASQEAQILIGPYAPWYLALSEENRERVAEACEVMGVETDKDEQAFQSCLENRYRELMGPYEDRYRREATGYIGNRQQKAKQLVGQCQAALRQKRNLLPRDLTFPVAYYDRTLSSLPGWMVEQGTLDELWLKRKGVIKAKDVMQAVLGRDCPGNMVLWATYEPLDF